MAPQNRTCRSSSKPGQPDAQFMRLAIDLARRGLGDTSPNPAVGAVLVKGGRVIGRGWHHRAGEPHAEIEALRDASKRSAQVRGATLYVTLEPCSTHGRTPPCTDAIIRAGIQKVVVGAADPNPNHRGKGLQILTRAGIRVSRHMEPECLALNQSFNHWIVHRTPLVLVKAAMSLDGRIATVTGNSKWITGPEARAYGMELRRTADAILVGVNTVLADDPSLTFRPLPGERPKLVPLRRIILDSRARTPLNAKVVSDDLRHLTTIVTTASAPRERVAALAKGVRVITAPSSAGSRKAASQRVLAKRLPGSGTGPARAPESPQVQLTWLLRKLGEENVTSLLVEGGGEVNASFLLHGLAQRIAFFYAPVILAGRSAPRAVAGQGIQAVEAALHLGDVSYRQIGHDLLLEAAVGPRSS